MQGEKIFITACLIVKNEAANITKWLHNVKHFADEIVIVDTGSTDDTVAIIKSDRGEGLRLYEWEWRDDFAAARNYALNLARGTWIVFPDADETFYAPQMVRRYLETALPEENGFWVPIVNVDKSVREQEISRFYALRIWRNRSRYQFVGKIHEALYEEGQPLMGLSYAKELAVKHTGYAAEAMTAKLTRNLGLLMKEIAATGEQPRHYRYLAQCYSGLGEPEKCIHYVQRALAAEPDTVAGKGELFHLMLKAMTDLEAPLAQELIVVRQARQAAPEDISFIAREAQILFQQVDYAGASHCLQEFWQQQEQAVSYTGATILQALISGAEALRGLLALAQEEYGEAAEWLKTALKHNPYQEDALSGWEKVCQYNNTDFMTSLTEFYTAADKPFLLQWAIHEGQADYLPAWGDDLSLLNAWRQGTLAETYKQVINAEITGYRELFFSLLNGGRILYDSDAFGCQKLLSLLPEEVQGVLRCLWGKQDTLSSAEENGYISVLQQCKNKMTVAAADTLAGLADKCSLENQLMAGRLLTDAEYYEQAIAVYGQIPQATVENDNSYWYGIGKCLFFMGDERAAACFQRAQAQGGTELDIPAYLAWLGRRTGG